MAAMGSLSRLLSGHRTRIHTPSRDSFVSAGGMDLASMDTNQRPAIIKKASLFNKASM
jgi:hypothetical protein